MTDDLTTLRDCFDAPDPAPGARAFARAALLERAAAETAGAVVQLAAAPARSRSSRIGRRVAAVGAAAAVMATAFMVLENIGGTGRDGGPNAIVPGLSVPAANAAEVLERAATASAARREFVPPRDDQWIYTAERVTGSDGEPMTQQQWARADGGAQAWIDEAGKLQIQAMDRPSDHPARRGVLEGYPLVASLPTDPAALRQWAYDRADGNWSNGPNSTSEEEIFLFFNHILRGNVMPPELEAAIFRVMSDLPGLTIENVEMFGSPAIAVGYESDWLRDEILLDPQTYEYVGERATVTRDATIDPDKAGNATGEVHEGSQVLAERLDIAVVDEPGELP
jgi:hypothetical protein